MDIRGGTTTAVSVQLVTLAQPCAALHAELSSFQGAQSRHLLCCLLLAQMQAAAHIRLHVLRPSK
jgi:hypothetical protein